MLAIEVATRRVSVGSFQALVSLCRLVDRSCDVAGNVTSLDVVSHDLGTFQLCVLLKALPNLKELLCRSLKVAPCVLAAVPVGLRRLEVSDIAADVEFVPSLPHLEELVLQAGDWGWDDMDPKAAFLPRLRRLTVCHDPNGQITRILRSAE